MNIIFLFLCKFNREAENIDQIFIQRQQVEKMIEDIESQIHQVYKATEVKIMSLGSQKAEQYKVLL